MKYRERNKATSDENVVGNYHESFMNIASSTDLSILDFSLHRDSMNTFKLNQVSGWLLRIKIALDHTRFEFTHLSVKRDRQY